MSIVQLRFGPEATIDEHSAPGDIDVVCLEGKGTTCVEGVSEPIQAGRRVRWPANTSHCLLTDGSGMVTLMLEPVVTGPVAAMPAPAMR